MLQVRQPETITIGQRYRGHDEMGTHFILPHIRPRETGPPRKEFLPINGQSPLINSKGDGFPKPKYSIWCPLRRKVSLQLGVAAMTVQHSWANCFNSPATIVLRHSSTQNLSCARSDHDCPMSMNIKLTAFENVRNNYCRSPDYGRERTHPSGNPTMFKGRGIWMSSR
jgi:hypothetical protein